MDYISKETIEGKLSSLKSSYYINLADLIENRLFDENSTYERNRLKEIAYEMEKIKDYCENEDIEVDFDFKFDEKKNILKYLEFTLNSLERKIEDFNLQLEIIENTASSWDFLSRVKASNIKASKAKKVDKYYALEDYIENFDENYKKDFGMLKPYFIELCDDDFVTLRLEIKIDHRTNAINVKVVEVG